MAHPPIYSRMHIIILLILQEVIDDIETVFANCRTYNREDAEEFQCGLRLQKYFQKEAKKLGLLRKDDGDEEAASNHKPAKKARRTF